MSSSLMVILSFAVLASVAGIAFTEDLSCSCGRENIDNRIIGGQKSLKNAFPWMTFVYIVNNDGKINKCGGSIINDRYILTAAHCFDNATKVHVLVGTNDIPKFLDYFRKVKSWIIHEEYDPKDFKNDIALIKVEKPLKFSEKISPICLPSKGQIATGDFTVAGWGETETEKSSDTLLQIDVSEYDFNLCNQAWQYTLNKKQICAFAYKKDACRGDSGGPLMKRTAGIVYAAGIVSFGPKECGKYPESVYTRVEPYLDWIRNNSVSGSFCSK